ncbi:HupE/UreJ family protein [Sulfurovum sp. CS9]|uniref:HupE/UreJ family protein n=1 Tax=Sulfurovum sp. CS9 TaxID=3391146 RepID=UPI0039E8A815
MKYLSKVIAFLLLSLFFTSSALAHFKLNLNVRIIHVEHRSDGLEIYMRLPMPYLVADLLGEADANGLPIPAPYTTNRMEEGKLTHYVDVKAIHNSLDEMKRLIQRGLNISVDDEAGELEVDKVFFYKNGTQSDFSTLEEAKASFAKTNDLSVFNNEVYVGDTTIDVLLQYKSASSINEYGIAYTLDPKLPNQDETANVILDYSPSGVQVFRERGLLLKPIMITNSLWDAMVTFIKEGVQHILDGTDHVLFVICLVLGSLSITRLLWRVTGFTLGHSVTLSLGFFGFVPSSAWFIPAVETGIAISIVYIAAVALLPDFIDSFKKEKSEASVVIITTLIGMLHGLGFSFVLQHILNVTSPNIWQSLLAFNIGVEIGQLFIVLVTLILLYLVAKTGSKAEKVTRYALAMGSIVIAIIWTVERGSSIVSAL